MSMRRSARTCDVGEDDRGGHEVDGHEVDAMLER